MSLDFESLSTWTETDAAGDLTVAADLVTFDTMRRDAVARVHRDFGANYFGNFEARIETQITGEQDQGAAGVFSASSALGSIADFVSGNSGVILFWYYAAPTWGLYLVDYVTAGDPQSSKTWTTTRPGKKYLTINRSGSAWSVAIYSDAGRTALEATLSITGTTSRLRYLQVATGRGAVGETATISGTIGNLYLEIYPGTISDAAGLGGTASAFSLTDELFDGSGLGDVAEGYDLKGDTSEGAGFGDASQAEIDRESELPDGAGLGDLIAGSGEIEAAFSDSGGLGDLADALNWTEWLVDNRDQSVVRYYCTVTGAADGTTDVVIPISSFQARKRNGDSTYLSVVIPGVAYADQIDARSNGDIVIDMAYLINGTEAQREEIVRAELEQINIQEGPSSRSITLVGHKDQTFVAKDSRLYDPIYKARTDGAISYRFAVPDLWLNPGDTAQVDDDEFTVDTVIYMVSAGGQTTMEVQESA